APGQLLQLQGAGPNSGFSSTERLEPGPPGARRVDRCCSPRALIGQPPAGQFVDRGVEEAFEEGVPRLVRVPTVRRDERPNGGRMAAGEPLYPSGVARVVKDRPPARFEASGQGSGGATPAAL